VLPEDVQAVFVAVAAHRLVAAPDAGATREDLARMILESVRVD
jgi:MoxR-like ATPase